MRGGPQVDARVPGTVSVRLRPRHLDAHVLDSRDAPHPLRPLRAGRPAPRAARRPGGHALGRVPAALQPHRPGRRRARAPVGDRGGQLPQVARSQPRSSPRSGGPGAGALRHRRRRGLRQLEGLRPGPRAGGAARDLRLGRRARARLLLTLGHPLHRRGRGRRGRPPGDLPDGLRRPRPRPRAALLRARPRRRALRGGGQRRAPHRDRQGRLASALGLDLRRWR